LVLVNIGPDAKERRRKEKKDPGIDSNVVCADPIALTQVKLSIRAQKLHTIFLALR